jgi:hypothetical protein
MKIKFITPEIHEEIKSIFDQNPELCFENEGYQYLPPHVREAKKEQIDRIEEILNEHVLGFVKFFNFRNNNGEIRLRFDYDWGAEGGGTHFTGVGYVKLDHLRDGFPVGSSQC